MNPVDHPHGGGEGKTSGGRHPVSPWGKPEGRTRQAHKPSDKLITRRRSKEKREEHDVMPRKPHQLCARRDLVGAPKDATKAAPAGANRTVGAFGNAA